ncbi:hypothetical protein GGX14DRAFT_560454 [Mycena pura]|uniref:Uncharacterized protein n=1 Tax=Mycena pura TaxID=153505 RepID=A0AAD6VT97_9AGAR|nr:hypothetical protein GGX14DRAFT_560454 [Mycena pura]
MPANAASVTTRRPAQYTHCAIPCVPFLALFPLTPTCSSEARALAQRLPTAQLAFTVAYPDIPLPPLLRLRRSSRAPAVCTARAARRTPCHEFDVAQPPTPLHLAGSGTDRVGYHAGDSSVPLGHGRTTQPLADTCDGIPTVPP